MKWPALALSVKPKLLLALALLAVEAVVVALIAPTGAHVEIHVASAPLAMIVPRLLRHLPQRPLRRPQLPLRPMERAESYVDAP